LGLTQGEEREKKRRREAKEEKKPESGCTIIQDRQQQTVGVLVG
jgi:hypothetical protein